MARNKKGMAEAFDMYTDGALSNEQIAGAVGVSTRTITKWIAEGEWKAKRNMRQVTAKELEQDVLEAMRDVLRLRKEATSATERVRLGDEYSKLNKSLENIRERGKLSLNAHITVLKDFNDFCNTRKPKIIGDLVDLQKLYITHKSAEYI